jgi:DNA-binding transcriptional ArsR family regulator
MNMFDALADPTRRKILELLSNKGPLSATEIGAHFPVSPPAISQHLKVLREADLVTVEKRAQQRIYRVNPEPMHELEGWARQVAQVWNQRFDALDNLLRVEKENISKVEKRKDESNE